MSAANFLSAADVANTEVLGASHHSVAMDNYSEDDEINNEELGVSEKPLGAFEKSFFALVSGYATAGLLRVISD